MDCLNSVSLDDMGLDTRLKNRLLKRKIVSLGDIIAADKNRRLYSDLHLFLNSPVLMSTLRDICFNKYGVRLFRVDENGVFHGDMPCYVICVKFSRSKKQYYGAVVEKKLSLVCEDIIGTTAFMTKAEAHDRLSVIERDINNKNTENLNALWGDVFKREGVQQDDCSE